MAVEWVSDLDTGISIIDEQHKKLLIFINQLAGDVDRSSVSKVLSDLIDYTVSHFAFEESLQEQAGYRHIQSHKNVHERFIEHVNTFVDRHDKGEDIVDDLYVMLSTWLIDHIKREDMAYVAEVKTSMLDIIAERIKKEDSAWISRFPIN